jgi:acyl carrier protein
VNDRSDSSQRLLERLQAIFRAVFDDGAVTIAESTSLGMIKGWDQARHLDLLAAIERAFGVRFTTREVSATGKAAATIGSVLDLLSSKQESASRSLRSSLEEAISEGQRRRILEAWVRDQVSAVLGVPPSLVGPSRVFQEMGMTSLTAVELCSRLETGLALGLAPTLAYNYPSLAQLVPYLASRMGSAGASDG